jgi:23S rRNA pseudouridine2457 synthase
VLIAFNKPFGVLSQFTPEAGHRALNEFDLPKGVYAAGRLDHDSEGLLLLTDEKQLIGELAHPRARTAKQYLAQVDGALSDAAIAQLQRGITLNDGPARGFNVKAIAEPAWLWPRTPPIRVRAQIPTSWLQLELQEGRNRQVRRMTAAVGFPTLRLLRVRIGSIGLGDLAPGAWRDVKLETQTR